MPGFHIKKKQVDIVMNSPRFPVYISVKVGGKEGRHQKQWKNVVFPIKL